MTSSINLPQQLVALYRKFYRAESKYQSSTRSILKPMITARETIKHSTFVSTEELIDAVAAALDKDIAAIKAGRAKGYWVIANVEEQREAIYNFARVYVEDLYIKSFRKDKSKLSSERGIGLIEDTIEYLYRLEQDKENKMEKLSKTTKETEEDIWSLSYPDEGCLLICGPGNLEIVVNDLDHSLAVKKLPDYGTDLAQESVEYPLDKPTEYSKESSTLQIITTSNGIVSQAKLYIGNRVSWELPFRFARELQKALLGTDIVS